LPGDIGYSIAYIGGDNLKKTEGICEMCGHFVAVRQKSHILDGRNDIPDNLLLLCSSCHIMFDTQLKPKLYRALVNSGLHLPEIWSKSIYERAAEASALVREDKSK
jgi:hypothetical protein